MDKTVVKAIKKSQEEKKRMGIENAAGGGYVAAQEKVFEKVEEYLANKTKIEELDKALKIGQSPGYIEHLIEKGYLYTDGKRVINSLNDTVCALVDYLNSGKANETDDGFPAKAVYITHTFVRRTFLQENEKPYSEIACRDAVKLAYVNFGRKPRGLHRSPREPNQSLTRR
jgi:hypothetical protein